MRTWEDNIKMYRKECDKMTWTLLAGFNEQVCEYSGFMEACKISWTAKLLLASEKELSATCSVLPVLRESWLDTSASTPAAYPVFIPGKENVSFYLNNTWVGIFSVYICLA